MRVSGNEDDKLLGMGQLRFDIESMCNPVRAQVYLLNQYQTRQLAPQAQTIKLYLPLLVQFYL